MREAGGLVLAALFVLGATIQCGPDWAHVPSSGDVPRTPDISAEQREQVLMLLTDALLEAGDVPSDMRPRSNGIERWVPADPFLDAGGWLAINNAWLDGSDVQVISDSRYAFADAAGAASYVDDLVAGLDGHESNPLDGLPAGAVGFSRTFQVYDLPEQREVELVAQQDRLLIALSVVMPAAHTYWREASVALLERAQLRTGEALDAGGP